MGAGDCRLNHGSVAQAVENTCTNIHVYIGLVVGVLIAGAVCTFFMISNLVQSTMTLSSYDLIAATSAPSTDTSFSFFFTAVTSAFMLGSIGAVLTTSCVSVLARSKWAFAKMIGLTGLNKLKK